MAKVDFDDKFLSIVSKRKSEAPRKIKELAVLELYRRKEISSGKAAELLDMDKTEFIKYASRLGIPFFEMSREELERDVQTLKKLVP